MPTRLLIYTALIGLLGATACNSSTALDNDTEATGTGGDDSDGDGGDGDSGGAEPTAMRMNQLTLLDPHAFVLGGLDITETVNGLILENVQGDDPADGLLDLSVVAVFRPLAPDTASTGLDVVFPDCTAPAETTLCTITPATQALTSSATNSDGPCLLPYPGTTSDFNPPVTAPAGRCFESGAASFSLEIGDLVIPLQDVKLAANYSGPGELAEGLIAGFLTEPEAESTFLPEDIPLVGGESINAILRQQDKDALADGTPGWWFYLAFTATEVALEL